jgi:hypothetical protein
MSVLAIIGAVLTIVGPALTPLLVMWVESYAAGKKRQPQEDIDEHVRQHMAGNPAGNINLATELARLQREAARKRHHP